MFKRRYYKGVCLLCALVFMLVGCADSLDTDPSGDTVPYSNGEGEVIEFFVAEYHVASQEVADLRMAQVNRLLLEQGITTQVRMKVMPSSKYTEAEIRKVDVFHTGINPVYAQMAGRNELSDLTLAINSFPDLKAMTPEDGWRQATVDGRIYAIPLVAGKVEPLDCVKQTSIAIRKDVVEDLDEMLPSTPEELIVLAQKAKAAGKPYIIARYGRGLPILRAFHRTYVQWPFYVDDDGLFLISADGSVTPYIGSDVFTQDMVYLSQMWEEGLLVDYNFANPYVGEPLAEKWGFGV